jgi:hypothetical protein
MLLNRPIRKDVGAREVVEVVDAAGAREEEVGVVRLRQIAPPEL